MIEAPAKPSPGAASGPERLLAGARAAALALLIVACAGCPGPGAAKTGQKSAQPKSGQGGPSTAPLDTRTPTPAGVKRIAMFIPHKDLFWRDFLSFMGVACEQLGMKLDVHLAQNNRELMKRQLREATQGAGRVDAVVFQNFKDCGEDLLAIASRAGVPAFLVNAGVGPASGKPRGRHKSWIGTMLSDGEAAGHALGELLTKEAKRRGLTDEAGKIHMIALAGIVSDASSMERVDGLKRALKGRKDVVLHQVVPTDWSFEEGARKAQVLLKRFPQTSVVWAASDPLALGAIKSAQALGRVPGKQILFGGFDWTAEALEAVSAGQLHTTVGGHFMEGGWVAVLLHDYLRGRDFAPKELTFLTPMRPITKANVASFLPKIKAAQWGRYDFRALAAPTGRYAFDPVETLRGLK